MPWTGLAALPLMLAATAALAEPTVGLLGATADNAFDVAASDLGLTLVTTPEPTTCEALLVCAPAYPEVRPLTADAQRTIERFLAAGRSVYLEYTPWPGRLGDRPTTPAYERLLVTSDRWRDSGLARLSLLEEHSSRCLPWLGESPADDVRLSYARAAGLDRAAFGAPQELRPALVELRHGGGRLLLAATALSAGRRGRYTPAGAWAALTRQILLDLLPTETAQAVRARWVEADVWTEPRDWVAPGEPVRLCVRAPQAGSLAATGPTGVIALGQQGERAVSAPLTLAAGRHEFRVTARRGGAQRAVVASVEVSPRPARYRQAVARNLAWFERAGMLIAPDGSAGVREGLTSDRGPDGRPVVAGGLRVDCVSECALAFWLHGRLNNDASWQERGRRMLAYTARAFQVTTADSWYWGHWQSRGEFRDDGSTIYVFNDDSGAATLFALLGYAATGDRALLRVGLRGVEYFAHVASDRTGLFGGMNHRNWEGSGPLGTPWPALRQSNVNGGAPHVMGLPLASLVAAYQLTGEQRYLNLAERGIGWLMRSYPDWQIVTSRSCEHARMVLPLALLCQAAPTAEHRRWLDQVAGWLVGRQADCGAITEWDGLNPHSNAAFGTGETSVFQQNGDPVSDQLYDTGFALLHLALAAQVTGEPRWQQAHQRLADYLTRIQLRDADPLLDGTWLRAFDYGRWEYFGSSADIGWGPYCSETGWMCAPMLLGFLLAPDRGGHRLLPDTPDAGGRPLAEAARREADAVEAGLGAPPPVVTDLVAAPTRGPYAQLTWTAAPGRTAAYVVHRATTPDFSPGPATPVGRTSAGRWLDDGLAPDTVYYYRVVATNGLGQSGPPSPTVRVLTGPVSKARGCRYQKSVEPYAGFPDGGNAESTDGVLAGPYGDGRSYGYRLAAVGDQLMVAVTIDLGREQRVARATHHNAGAPGYRPDRMAVAVSLDGRTWHELGSTADATGHHLVTDSPETPARFVRFTFSKQRHGATDDWLFLDELEVY